MVRAKPVPKEATNEPSTDTADVDKPLATSRIDQPLTSARSGARTAPQTSPPRPHQPPSPARKKLRSAAQAANHLIKNAEAASKDRKGAVAAAARLFDLAASDPDTKIEFVAEDGTVLNDSDDDEADGAEVFLEDAMEAAGHAPARATAEAWAAFWASKPKVVAVDAEGTHASPPLLVQLCADSSATVLLCGPGDDGLEPDLARLLGDASIAKLFYGPPRRERLGPVARGVDVQALAAARDAGGEKSGLQKGLATVAGEVCRGAPFAKHKELQKSFRYVKRAPDHGSLAWLSHAQARYAAADAWATLELHRSLCADAAAEDLPPEEPRKRKPAGRDAGRPRAKKAKGDAEGTGLDIEISFQ